MVNSNMTPALYKSLLILKEIRVMLLQRRGVVGRAEGSAVALNPHLLHKRSQNLLLGEADEKDPE
jgi:hypothetical protein